MLKYVLHDLRAQGTRNTLTLVSLIIALTLCITAVQASSATRGGLVKSSKYYDTLITEKTSDFEAVMSVLYYFGNPPGLISADYYSQLTEDARVARAVPLVFYDEYQGYRMIGTTFDYLLNWSIKDGTTILDKDNCVLGYEVAKALNLSVGDTITYLCHDEKKTNHEHSLTVGGILDRMASPDDRVIFVAVEQVWEEHGSTMVSAVLLRCKSSTNQQLIQAEYSKDVYVQAINPASTVRSLLSLFDTGTGVVTLLVGISIIISLLSMFMCMLATAHDSLPRFAILRAFGVRRSIMRYIVLLETLIIGALAAVISLIASAVLLTLLRGAVADVLNVQMSSSPFSFTSMGLIIITLLACVLASLIPMRKINTADFSIYLR